MLNTVRNWLFTMFHNIVWIEVKRNTSPAKSVNSARATYVCFSDAVISMPVSVLVLFLAISVVSVML